MDKIVVVGGKTVTFRSTALIPRIYRHLMGRDMMRDMAQLRKSYEAAETARKNGADEAAQNEAGLSVIDLEIFENVAWVMLKHAADPVYDDAGNRIGARNGDMDLWNSPDEWLDHLDGIFDVYEVLPEILDLWNKCQQTTSSPAKK